MRIKTIEIEGFRAFTNRQVFDLDADAVVIQGSNGQGKTSFFDAFLWCLAGSIPRLENITREKKGDETRAPRTEEVVSKYTQTGVARVSLTLSLEGGSEHHVSRTSDGSTQRLVLRRSGTEERLTGASAEQELRRLLWPDAQITPDPAFAVVRALTRSVYLQQDRLREFIEADSDDERFSAISELVGVGRLTDLRDALDRERRQWTRSLTELSSRIDDTQRKCTQVRTELAELESSGDGQVGPEAWDRWWKRATHWISNELYTPLDAASAPDALDAAVRSLLVHERKLQRRRSQLQSLDSLLKTDRPADSPNELSAQIDRLQVQLDEAESRLKAADQSLRSAQERASKRVQELVARQERSEQMVGLAEIALRLLDSTCPVCTQSIDREQIEIRLREIVEASSNEMARDDHGSEVESASIARRKIANEVHSIQRALTTSRESLARHKEWEDGVSNTLEALGLEQGPISNLESVIASEVSAAEQKALELKRTQESGEALATDQARRAQEASRREAQARLERLESKLEEMRVTQQKREKTGRLAAGILEKLRDSETQFVQKRLEEMAPLLMRVFARMDPHPSFRDVALTAHTYYGKGRVKAALTDHVRSLHVDNPESILSSSQVNVLALAIFLSLNLGIPTLPLNCALLDDPVQSLDDVNLLGLSDLLRRLRQRRQVIVSTHDETLGRLLVRKLRPLEQSNRTVVHRLQGWGRSGPTVETEDVPLGDRRLRVVA